jgi:hypothetical protein
LRRRRSPEDEALARVLFQQLMVAQRDERVLRDGAFGLVLRTRLGCLPMTGLATGEEAVARFWGDQPRRRSRFSG